MAYLVRILLPDRPGSLGALAVGLGGAGIDIVSVDIVERTDAGAVDDLIVELPSGSLPDRVVAAAHTVPGVRVLSLRPYPMGLDIHRELTLVEEVAADPARGLEHLVAAAPEVFRSGWAVVVRGRADGNATDAAHARVLHGSTAAPATLGAAPTDTLPFLPAPAATRLDGEAAWVPPSWRRLATELAVAPVGDPSLVVMVGRPGGPEFLSSEVLRLGHLASIVGSVLPRVEPPGR